MNVQRNLAVLIMSVLCVTASACTTSPSTTTRQDLIRDELPPVVGEIDLKGDEWPLAISPTGESILAYLESSDGASIVMYDLSAGAVSYMFEPSYPPQYSGDGSSIFFADPSGEIFRMNADATSPTTVIEDAQYQLFAPSFDGSKLALLGPVDPSANDMLDTLRIVDMSTEEITTVGNPLLRANAISASPLQWDLSAKRVLLLGGTADGEEGLYIADLESNSLEHIANAQGPFGGYDLSPDGRSVVFEQINIEERDGDEPYPTTLFVVDLDSEAQDANPVPGTQSSDVTFRFPQWSPDGSRVLVTGAATLAGTVGAAVITISDGNVIDLQASIPGRDFIPIGMPTFYDVDTVLIVGFSPEPSDSFEVRAVEIG